MYRVITVAKEKEKREDSLSDTLEKLAAGTRFGKEITLDSIEDFIYEHCNIRKKDVRKILKEIERIRYD